MPPVRKKKRRPSVTRKAKITAVVSAAAAAALAFGGLYLQQQETLEANAAEAASYSPAPVVAATDQPEQLTFTAVGDSITAGDSPDFQTGKAGSLSWASYAGTEGVRFVGGWASGGAQTSSMAERVVPVAAGSLVIVAGTNDAKNAVPFEATASNLQAIVAKVGSERVILSGVPPIDANPEASSAFNAQLEELAADQGWQWVDSFAPARGEDGAYLPGLTSDGIHPTQESARMAGERIRDALLAG